MVRSGNYYLFETDSEEEEEEEEKKEEEPPKKSAFQVSHINDLVTFNMFFNTIDTPWFLNIILFNLPCIYCPCKMQIVLPFVALQH